MNNLGSSQKEPQSKNKDIFPKLFIASNFRREKKCCDCGGSVTASEINRKQVLLFGSGSSLKCGKCAQKTAGGCTLERSSQTEGVRKSINVFVQYSTKMTQCCNECNEVFTSKGELQKHMETHGQFVTKGKRVRKKVTCSDCNMFFYKKGDLQLHRREEHSPRRIVCPVCKKTFDTEKRLKMHSQFHNVGGEFKCFYCEKRFNKGWKLKIHLVNHTGKAPFFCEHCGEDFLYPGKIAIHMKEIHDLWHVCKGCGSAFKYWNDFHRHVCKFYCCKDCAMCFETFDELAAHAESHSKSDNLGNPLEVSSGVGASISVTDQHAPVQTSHDNEIEVVKEAVNVEVLDITQLSDSSSLKSFESPSPDKDVIIHSYIDHSPLTQAKKVVKRLINYGHCSDLDKIMTNVTAGLEGRIDLMESIDAKGEVKSSGTKKLQEKEKEKAAQLKTFLRDIKMRDVISNSKVSLSVSSCSSLEPDFKVPDASVSTLRKCDDSFPMSLQMRQDEFSKSIKKKIGSTFKFCLDSDLNRKQKYQSFESWLTGDTPHDFVFGFSPKGHERSDDSLNESHCQYINKMILKKKKSDMSFADLCLF